MTEAARGRGRLGAILIAMAFVLVAAGTWLRWTAPAPETVEAAGETATLRSVQTLRIVPRAIRPLVRLDGVLEARRTAVLVSETRGRVVEVGARELDRVQADQVLLKVDPLLARVAVERAAAAVARAESELALAHANLERRRSLAGREVVSEAALDDAENAARVADASLRDARAAREEALDALAKKTLKAPFGGVLRTFDGGLGDTLQIGQRVGELVDASIVIMTVGLADREVVAVHPGQLAQVSVAALPTLTFSGTLVRVAGAAEAQSRKFPVEVELPNPDGRLLPGMVGRVELDLGPPVARLLVPREATVDEFGLRTVWVLESDGNGDDRVARRRRVTLRPLPFQPDELEVVSGLAEGEEIALTAIRQLRDGERVRPGRASP